MKLLLGFITPSVALSHFVTPEGLPGIFDGSNVMVSSCEFYRVRPLHHGTCMVRCMIVMLQCGLASFIPSPFMHIYALAPFPAVEMRSGLVLMLWACV